MVTKEQREQIKNILTKRKEEITYIDNAILQPLRNGNKRLERVLKGELPIEHEIKNQERLNKFIKSIFIKR